MQRIVRFYDDFWIQRELKVQQEAQSTINPKKGKRSYYCFSPVQTISYSKFTFPIQQHNHISWWKDCWRNRKRYTKQEDRLCCHNDQCVHQQLGQSKRRSQLHEDSREYPPLRVPNSNLELIDLKFTSRLQLSKLFLNQKNQVHPFFSFSKGNNFLYSDHKHKLILQK